MSLYWINVVANLRFAFIVLNCFAVIGILIGLFLSLCYMISYEEINKTIRLILIVSILDFLICSSAWIFIPTKDVMIEKYNQQMVELYD